MTDFWSHMKCRQSCRPVQINIQVQKLQRRTDNTRTETNHNLADDWNAGDHRRRPKHRGPGSDTGLGVTHLEASVVMLTEHSSSYSELRL